VSFIISKAIALQLDYKSKLYNTHKKTTNIIKIAKKHRTNNTSYLLVFLELT